MITSRECSVLWSRSLCSSQARLLPQRRWHQQRNLAPPHQPATNHEEHQSSTKEAFIENQYTPQSCFSVLMPSRLASPNPLLNSVSIHFTPPPKPHPNRPHDPAQLPLRSLVKLSPKLHQQHHIKSHHIKHEPKMPTFSISLRPAALPPHHHHHQRREGSLPRRPRAPSPPLPCQRRRRTRRGSEEMRVVVLERTWWEIWGGMMSAVVAWIEGMG